MEEMFANAQTEEKVCACKQCGASLKYKPGTLSLFCEYCESFTEIEAVVAKNVVERDFLSYAGKTEEQNKEVKKVLHCHQCGAESIFEEHIKSVPCPYCNTQLVEKDAHEERLIQASYLQPFQISQEMVHHHLRGWLKGLFFAPNKLKKQASYSHELKGIYLPYWTYDAQTETDYRGMRGDTYTVTVGSGKNRRTQTRTRWSNRSGRVSLFFDDILVPASQTLSKDTLKKIDGWNTKKLVEANDSFYHGFTTRKYTVGLKEGFWVAQEVMEKSIKTAIQRKIGGNYQRILWKNTTYKNVKFKLILLPVYISSYRYKHKLYHFYVNGYTGKVTGDHPHSTIKIVTTVLVFLALIFLLYFYITS